MQIFVVSNAFAKYNFYGLWEMNFYIISASVLTCSRLEKQLGHQLTLAMLDNCYLTHNNSCYVHNSISTILVVL